MPVSKKTISKEVTVVIKKPATKVVLVKAQPKLKTKTAIKTPVVKKSLIKTRVSSLKSKNVLLNKKVERKVKSDEVVYLPSTTSLRLQEKVQLYNVWYKENFSYYASKSAQYGGYVFIVLGTLLTTFNYFVDKNHLITPAAVVCANDSCLEIENSALPVGSPLISFMSSLPEEISSNIDFVVKTENTTDFKIKVLSTFSGEVIILELIEVISENEFRYLLKPSLLKSAVYAIHGEVVVADTTFRFNGPTFSILENEKELTVLTSEELESDIELSTSTSTSTSTPLTSATSPVSSVALEESLATTTAASSSKPIFLERSISVSSTPISVSLKNSAESDYISIKTGNYLPKKVEIYSTVIGSDNKVFLGLATLVQGEWLFSLSAFDLPNTEHLIFASFAENEDIFTSEGVRFIPMHSNQANKESEVDLDISNRKVLSALLDAGLDTEKRSNYFSSSTQSIIESENIDTELQFSNQIVIDRVSTIMLENSDKTNIILQVYASAYQVGLPYLINLADSVIRSHYEDMAKVVVESIGTETLLPSVNTIFALRFHSLKNYINNSESNFNTFTNQQFSKDTDSDGISDFDEINLYGSDPISADSDKDSVTDGVEIISLNNPSLSDLLSFAFINQNIEGINPNESTSITSVMPLVYKQIIDAEDHVYALVRGNSIPNSFVYIFNNAEPTVGFIKTNKNGEFLYTFEKNLVDGPQEFIAVQVNNSGRIVSSSNKYSFIKSTNSFVASTASVQQPIFSSINGENSTVSANAIASITVVSFGFLLLLLSQAVQTRRKFSPEIKGVKAA